MIQQEFDKVVKETWENIQTLLEVKGGEYAGTEDRLGNFKRGASLTGAHSLQVLFIYLSKHYDAFATYVRDQASGEDRPRSESITGRLDDIINYCILAKALVRELENEEKESKREIKTFPTTDIWVNSILYSYYLDDKTILWAGKSVGGTVVAWDKIAEFNSDSLLNDEFLKAYVTQYYLK